VFLQNFSPDERALPLPHAGYFDLVEQRELSQRLELPAWGSTVLRRAL
jgi:hypothetical protein